MQLLVLQSRHLTGRLLHPGHAVPALVRPSLRAQRTERFAPGMRFLSVTVLFLMASLVTVDGLRPASRAILLTESPLSRPSSMMAPLSLSICLLMPSSRMAAYLPAGSQQNDTGDDSGKAGPAWKRSIPAPIVPAIGSGSGCSTACNSVAVRNATHFGDRWALSHGSPQRANAS